MNRVDLPPIEVYHGEIDNRVNEAMLSIGGVYTVIFKLKNFDLCAIRHAARIEAMRGDCFDDQQVRYIGLDDDLRPYNPLITANVHDGLLDFRGHRSPVIAIFDEAERPFELLPETGFFVDYGEPFGTDQALREALDLGSALVNA